MAHLEVMKLRLLATVLCVLAALPVAAQNTDIEALSGLQFNFGNPGARSLGMGGAFVAVADDASAAESNPAGLTILRKSEVSLETRRVTMSQNFVTGGVYPYVTRADFPSERESVSFASVVMPTNAGTFAIYFHRPLDFHNAVDLTGRYSTPTFYLAPEGPVSATRCSEMDDCRQHQIYPFATAANLSMETFGAAYARAWRGFSAGIAVRYHQFSETATTYRRDLDAPGQPVFVVSQTNGGQIFGRKNDTDVTWSAGLKWAGKRVSLGAVYKAGAGFPAPVWAGLQGTQSPALIGSTDFHTPDEIAAGVAFRPAKNLTISADAVRMSYSRLTDQFISVMEYGANPGGMEIVRGYSTSDGTELHAGAEYFFVTRVPFAIRAGWWRDPAHAVVYGGDMVTSHDVAARILFPGAEAESHYSAGLGLSWQRFQIDAAYDTSRTLKTASVSFIARY